MNINILYLTDYTFSIFKENIIHPSNQGQKIVLIALLALGCLVSAYWMMQCCLKSKPESKELEDPKAKNASAPTQKIVSFLNSDLNELKGEKIQAQSAKVFITLQFEHKEIKKEFIIKKLTKDSLDDSFVAEQAEKIRQYIEKEIKESFGICNKLQMMAFFNDTANHFHNVFHEVKYSDSGDSEDGSMGISIEQPPGRFAVKYQMVIDKMGFPKEKQIEDREFVPGTFYQALD